MNANQLCSTFMYFPYKRIAVKESLRGGLPGLLRSFLYARHGRALTGESPEHAQVVGSV